MLTLVLHAYSAAREHKFMRGRKAVNSCVTAKRSTKKEIMKLLSYFRGVRAPFLIFGLACLAPGLRAQETRKVVAKQQPAYPAMAKELHLRGVVKLQVVIATNGHVKETKVVGGHPLLVDAALQAAKNWKFEPGSSETTEILEFRFEPQ